MSSVHLQYTSKHMRIPLPVPISFEYFNDLNTRVFRECYKIDNIFLLLNQYFDGWLFFLRMFYKHVYVFATTAHFTL